jgi:hypothetical protein
VPAAERDGEPPGIVHADHAGVAALIPEERGYEAYGGTGSEEEDYLVTLVPGGGERFFRLAFVEAGLLPNLSKIGGPAAAVRGGGDEPDHGFLPETTKTGVSAARR